MSEREHSMNEFRYPQASRLDLTEDIGGHQVSDPYRWMEDNTSAASHPARSALVSSSSHR